ALRSSSRIPSPTSCEHQSLLLDLPELPLVHLLMNVLRTRTPQVSFRFCCACFRPVARSDKRWYLYTARVSLHCGVQTSTEKTTSTRLQATPEVPQTGPPSQLPFGQRWSSAAGGACILTSAFCLLPSAFLAHARTPRARTPNSINSPFQH